MITIIAGSTTISDYHLIIRAIKKSEFEITKIVSGGAIGVDKLGEIFSFEENIPLVIMPANWKDYGKPAGIIRNREMAKISEALVAVWDGKSHGTKNMIETAAIMGLKVFVFNISNNKFYNVMYSTSSKTFVSF